ncbi:MAG: thiamine-phosphate kinase [Campylobacteraceae bacterium]
MDKESYIISKFDSKFIGDDGAVVGDFVYSKDIFAQDVHFKKEWLTLFQISQKAMLVNISDAIAMNAKPLYALIGAVIPKDFSKNDIDELSQGFLKTAKKFGVEIIGGDTTSGEKLVISITIVAKKRKNTLKRAGLKEGDLLAFTGELGGSLKDLNKLFKGEQISKNSRFIAPTLRGEFIKKSAKYLRCGLDISDGLSKDLSRLCKLANLGAKFMFNIDERVLCSGEEYEMLFAFDEANRDKNLKIAKKTDTKVTIFAKAVKGRYINRCKEHHF